MGKAGVLAGIVILLGAALAAGGDEVILKSRTFVPAAGLSETLHTRLAAVEGRVHVLIQLDGVPTADWRAALVEEGVKLLSYIPNRAWFASIPADKAAEVAQLPGIRAVCEVLPRDKLARSIRQTGINAYSTTATGQAKLTALGTPQAEPGAPAPQTPLPGGDAAAPSPQTPSAAPPSLRHEQPEDAPGD